MSALLLALQIVAVAASLSGAILSTIGSRRAKRGAALQRAASSLASQLSRPPVEVIGEALRGSLMKHSGLQLARRGLILAAGGFVVAVAALAALISI